MTRRWPLLAGLALAAALTGAAFAASVPVALAPGDSLSASCAPGFVQVTVWAGEIDAVCPTLTSTPTATSTSTPSRTPTATATVTSTPPVVGTIDVTRNQSTIWIYNPGPDHAVIDASLSAANLNLTPIGTPIAEQTMIVAPRTTAVIDSWDVPGPLPTPPWVGVASIQSDVTVTAVSLPGTPTPGGTP